MRKNMKKVLGSVLALSVALTSEFATSPALKAETVEVVQEISQNNAENMIIIHAKGTGLKIHVWGGSKPTTEKYPGELMAADPTMGDGWVYYEVCADCKGFIINNGQDGDANKLTGDVTGMAAGEYWFVDGKFSTTNPGGGTATTTPTVSPSESVTPSASPEVSAPPVTDAIKVESITPADGTELKAGVEQTITVKASTDIGDKVLYYKMVITCDGKSVASSYYSKSPSRTFTPEDGKTYEVTVYVQAHDEDNTTTSKKVTYKGSATGAVNTAQPTASPVVTPSTAPTATPGTDTATSKPTSTPGATATVTSKPTQTPDMPGMNVGGDATPTPTVVPTPNVPDNNGFASEEDLKVTSFKPSVTSTVKAGTKITLKAAAKGGDGTYQYKFQYKIGNGSKKTIRSYSQKSSCTWTPKENGTYTLYVTVEDEFNVTASKTYKNFKVKGLTASVSAKKKGSKYTVKVTPKNSSGKVKYKFVVKRAGKTVSRNKTYMSAKSYTFKASKKGTYSITVYIKDNNTTIKKTIKVTRK